MGCVLQAFELATGDYLFEPHSGEDYTRDEGQCCLFLFFFPLRGHAIHFSIILYLYNTIITINKEQDGVD